LIRVDRVVKRYPAGIDALIDVSFEVDTGELVLIEGHSGAGKSTLLKLIAAIERPTEGAVLVNNQNIGAMKRAARPFFRRNLGLVMQDQKLLFDRNALDNVLLPLSIVGFPAREAASRARAALDKVGLLARESAFPAALSGGEQQRLAIARAVVNRPKLLLVDEPTAHLDATTAQDIARIFLEFHRVGVTVLVATYDHGLFGDNVTRRIVLDHGRRAL
jgi:cell division transport system ATP-binding protein